MLCKDCARYDAENEKCRDGKLNPEGWGSAVTVANSMGVRAICVFNDYRERLVRSRIEAHEKFGKAGATPPSPSPK